MKGVLRHRTGLPVKVETRAGGTGPVIAGYAAVFYDAADPGTEYRLWEDIVERIMPGAFDRAVRDKHDVRALFNHDASRVLGRTQSGTARLSVDARGLRYEIDPPDTQDGRDVVKLIERGDVSASSFGFVPMVTAYREEGKVYVVERQDVDLFDVSPVTFPAYTATEVGVRADLADQERRVRKEIAEAKGWGAINPAPAYRARAVEVLLTIGNN